MIARHSVFDVDIGKQLTRPHLRTAHRFLLLFFASTGIRFGALCQRRKIGVFQQAAKSRRTVRERALLVVLAFGMILAVVWSVFLARILVRAVIRSVF